MNVYIAAPYPIRDYAIGVMRQLQRHGIACTSRWLKEPDALTHEHALKDLQDVFAADVLIALNPDKWTHTGTGGRHVELGYALAHHIPILLIGERTNIFHHLECVTQIDELQDFTKAVLLLRDRLYPVRP